MAGAMPNFLARLMRPFTSSTRLSLNPDSTSMTQSMPDTANVCIVAAGCFWGVEHLFRKNFEGKGLVEATVGYIGGDIRDRNNKSVDPIYHTVCKGKSGYAEALKVTFDPSVVSYNTLIEFFYRMHDPTTKNAQGGDTGSQYRSAIFYQNPEQEQVAKSITEKAQNQWWKAKITTEISQATNWHDAEAYHQLYLDRNPGGYQCEAHRLRPFEPLK